jgi:spermidine dehydrogenase
MPGKKSITRRDFLDGAAVAIATTAVSSSTIAATAVGGSKAAEGLLEDSPEASKLIDYPPSLTGMRGNHPGSYDYAHPLAWSGEAPQDATDTGEEYDLIVVGGGLSGLAAACLFQRERGTDQRILILDNHDDFGGHAKRNEFTSDGKMLLSIGGSVNMDNPNAYSKESRTLLEEVGVDFEKLEKATPEEPLANFLSGESGLFLKTKNGGSKTVVGQWLKAFHGYGDYKKLINQLPFPRAEKDKIIRLSGDDWDYLVGLSIKERMDYLIATPYHQFLLEKVGLSPDSLSLFDSLTRVLFGVGGDGISAHEAILTGSPGLGVVGWPWDLVESYIFGTDAYPKSLLFPDGNATLARLMVRNLIPGVAPGNSMDDIVAARFDYSELDRDGSPVRLRLNSTVVDAQQKDDQVSVRYVKNGEPYSAKANHCIMACYNAIIPHICPQLPAEQKEGLKYGSKIPLIWASVAIKDKTPFKKAGAKLYQCPDSYFTVVTLAPTTKLADYQAPSGSGDPMAVFMMRSPVPIRQEGQTPRDLFRQARYGLLDTPFETFEEEIRGQLTDLFAVHGFDADRDIEAITINRWAHGYAYEYLDLDGGSFEEGSYPHEIGRRQSGRISIANSDAGASAYLNVAIDQAWRAVQEQLFITNKQK